MTKNLVIILLSAILIVMLLFTCSRPEPKPPAITAPKVVVIMDTIWGDTLKFYRETVKLQKRIDGLTKQLSFTKNELHDAEQAVNDILQSLPKNDTTDLLKQIVIIKDSLIHSAFTQLDSIITLKDNQLTAAKQLKQDLLKSINELEQGSLQKDEIISYWKKEAKKQKRNKVLFKIATGVAALFIIDKALQ